MNQTVLTWSKANVHQIFPSYDNYKCLLKMFDFTKCGELIENYNGKNNSHFVLEEIHSCILYLP